MKFATPWSPSAASPRRIAKLVEPNSPLRGYVEVIQEEVTRLEKLLREILDFTGENRSYYRGP